MSYNIHVVVFHFADIFQITQAAENIVESENNENQVSGTEPDEGMAVDEDKPEDGEAGGIYIQYVTVCMKYLAFYTHAGS